MSTNIEAVKALDLVQEPRFRQLLSIVRDNEKKASVKYPVGFGSCFIDLKTFLENYAQQEERKVTYTVSVPVSLLRYRQGQVRLVRENYCVQNFQLFNHTVDFCESESPVVFFDESTTHFDIVKKQHTVAQVAAIAAILDKDINVMVRVVAFNHDVTTVQRAQEASRLFYKEVKGINDTKDWEKLYHQVAYGEQSAINTMNFYKSITGYTWQPVAFPFPLVDNPQFCTTKVREMKKLVEYATNDDMVDELRSIVQTIVSTVDWSRESQQRELSVYLLRGLYNFEKRLHPLLEDAMGGLGIPFEMNEHLETFFANKTIKKYLGSTSIDKRPWQHLVKVAAHVNTYLVEKQLIDDNFFSLRNKQFFEIVFKLANPKKDDNVPRSDVENYIRQYCPAS
jgi:hypothetical protein